MGRRALRRIDPNLDLSEHLRVAEELPESWRPERLFARAAQLEIEVGSGKGLFLAAAAAACPERNFLGIEIGHKYARFAAARLAKRALANGRMIQGDALELFRLRVADASLAAVHVYFPDPWWKARHRKRRVMNEHFLADVVRTLEPGGTLHFWTDVEEYFETTLELIAACTSLVGPLAVPQQPAEHDLDYRTHFERRMRLHNRPVYRSEFGKPAIAAERQSGAAQI
jgi:tRNA (guanine-N7-)-methyltransferase